MNTTETKTPSNAFTTLLAQIRKGELVSELSNDITAAIDAMKRAGGKTASVTLELKFKAVESEVNSLFISAEVKTKLPKPDKSPALFYTTEDNQLQRNDPNQAELALKVVDGAKTDEPLREAVAN